MILIRTPIPGCFELQATVTRDSRGTLVKTFHQEQFERLGLETRFAEEFHSYSKQGVLRGLHFMAPPLQQVKIVHCVLGSILDAILDLRRGSPTFGRHFVRGLSAETGNLMYLGRGVAHGFYVLSPEAVVSYRVSTLYSREHDQGVRWDSVGIEWPVQDPIISARDASLPAFADFETPFRFEEEEQWLSHANELSSPAGPALWAPI